MKTTVIYKYVNSDRPLLAEANLLKDCLTFAIVFDWTASDYLEELCEWVNFARTFSKDACLCLVGVNSEAITPNQLLDKKVKLE